MTTPNQESDVTRDISGETVCGFRVAAYRETHPEHGDKYGHRYSEHWSTPSRNPAVKVERLFTEEQLRAALRSSQEKEQALREALVDHNDLLRSAFTAAQRDAAHDVRGTTNYRTLADRAHEVLTKHHDATNAARAALLHKDPSHG
jgi:hypothetical protein